MQQHHFLIERLHENLSALLSGRYTAKQLNEVIQFSHTVAVSWLETKSATGCFSKTLLHLSVDDAAYDCVADLFRRDESGKFFVLSSYFAAFKIDSLSTTDVVSHVRRIVFTKVNDGIARLYHESDPMLSRILRNIRLAVHSLDCYIYIERFGEQYLAPSLCDLSEHLPKLDEQTLEQLLLQKVRGNENVMEIVGALALTLREQEEYCRLANIMQVAIVIRSIYSRKALIQYSPDTIHNNKEQEVIEIIHSAITHVQQKFHPKYVLKEKMGEQTYLLYFDVIEKKINQMMIDGSANGESLFHVMQQNEPALTEEQYRKEHKSRLEYLFKLSCDTVVKEIQK